MQPGPSNYYSAQPSTSASTSTSTSNTALTTPTSQASLQAVFDEFESYPFSQDKQFNAGLPDVIAVIKDKRMPASAIDETIARAQWFYFTRVRLLNIPWETYAAYIQNDSTLSPPTLPGSPAKKPNEPTLRRGSSNPWTELNSLAEARRMLSPPAGENDQSMSFGMLSKLIAEGRAGELKGRDIPDQLNETPPSQSIQAQRPKPWEANQTTQDSQYGIHASEPYTQLPIDLSYASYGLPPSKSTSNMSYSGLSTSAQTLSAEYAPSPTSADPFAGSGTAGLGPNASASNYPGTSYSYEDLEETLGHGLGDEALGGPSGMTTDWFAAPSSMNDDEA